MAKRALGIDIGDDFITAVVTRLKGKQYEVLYSHSVPRGAEEDLEDQLDLLAKTIGWTGRNVVCGLPLSMISVRNLFLPFVDKKKITQALPMELEDQLISPMEEQSFDFSSVSMEEGGNHILAFSLQKELLLRCLAPLKAHGIDPVVVTPRILALVAMVRKKHNTGPCLLLWVDFSSLSLVLLSDGVCRFCRRIAYPEEMVFQSPFELRDGRVEIRDAQRADACFRDVSASIRQSLDFLYFNDEPVGAIDQILLTGPMAGHGEISVLLQKYLTADVQAVDMRTLVRVSMEPEDADQFLGHIAQTALCLSLAAHQKSFSVNLRQGDLAPGLSLFSSRKQMVAAAAVPVAVLGLLTGYLALDVQRLEKKEELQMEQMVGMYKELVPAASNVRDPYGLLTSALKRMGSSGTTAPFLGQEKRNLELLADISSRLPATLELQVDRMVIDQNSLMMRGVTNTYNNVDAIKNALSASHRYGSVQIVSATADKKTKMVRFEIQLELGGV